MSVLGEGTTLGGWCHMPGGFAAEVMAAAGFDWILVDRQHGLIGESELFDMLRALTIRVSLSVVFFLLLLLGWYLGFGVAFVAAGFGPGPIIRIAKPEKFVGASTPLDIVIDTLFPEHPFDDVYSNRLIFGAHDRLVGWQATPFDLNGKPLALRELSKKHSVTLARSAFVGDGDNDVPMIGVAGCVIAFNPRSVELARRAHHVVREPNLSHLLNLIG